MSVTDKFYANPSPARAVALARADHDALNGGRGIGEFTDQLRRAEKICTAWDDVVAALADAVAYVELSTGNGVQRQPSAYVRLPNGDFDAELIAKNARAALALVSA